MRPDEAGKRDVRGLVEAAALLLVTLGTALALRFPGAWLLIPLIWLTVVRRDLEEYGLHWRNLQGVGFHLALWGAIFVPYLFLHWAYGCWWLGLRFALTLPDAFGSLLLEQIFGVGLPEEFFFRAYLQTQFDHYFGYRWRLLGARIGWGLPSSAGIFAFCHIFHGGPARLVTFFPGLLYGWLWAYTGNVFVPAFYHGVSNILMSVMLTSLRSS